MVAHPPFDVSGVSGTELNKLIVKRNIKQWSRLSFPSIYYSLNQLEKKKLIRAKEPSNDSKSYSDIGAPQKLFVVTPMGQRTLKSTVTHYFTNMDLNYEEMNLALAAAFVLDEKEFLEKVRNYKRRIDERIQIVQGRFNKDIRQNQNEDLPIHVWAMFNYAFSALNAKNEFLGNLIEKLEKYRLEDERSIG
jgi:DNA-binding PadR family transcriptional regulator